MKLITPVVPPSLTRRVAEIDAWLGQGEPAAPASKWLLRLMRNDGPAIVRMLWRTLGRQQDVLDAYQECLCRLVAAVREGDRTPPRRYAFQTALNIAIDMRRRRRVRQDHMMTLAADRPVRPLQSQTPRPSFVELMDQLRSAIDALPDHLRQVIILRDLAEMSYRDVADLLGLTIGTARVYRREAIVRLSELLRE